jgi:hypothetical protein
MAEGSKKNSSAFVGKAHLLNIKNPKRAAERLKFSFQRTEASLKNIRTGKDIACPLVLIDMSETGIGAFAMQSLPIGTKVLLTIGNPYPLVVTGMVAWCIPTPSLMDSTQVRHPFRCGVKFVPANAEETKSITEYCNRILTCKAEIKTESVLELTPVVAPTTAESPITAEPTAPIPEIPQTPVAAEAPATAEAVAPAASAEPVIPPSTDGSGENKAA